jgi:hypothetical protein
LIARITDVPTQGQDPNLLFADKKTEKTPLEEMRENFHTIIGVCGLEVLRTCDPTISLAM